MVVGKAKKHAVTIAIFIAQISIFIVRSVYS